jgi:outer membrane lipoprotein carrier protein
MFGQALFAFFTMIQVHVGAAQPLAKRAGPTAPPVAAAPVAAPATKASPEAIVAGVQRYYQNTSKLQATFRQRYQNTTFVKTTTSDGKLYIEKPGKMRWDYLKPDKTLYISDGTTLWIYEERNRQAFKKSLENTILPVAVTFLYGKGNLSSDFTPSAGPAGYGAPGDLVVTLTPKTPSAQYKVLYLVCDPTDFHVKESVIIEASGNENRFTFSHILQNARATSVTPAMFRFKPPAGVKVIESPEDPAAKPTKGNDKAN